MGEACFERKQQKSTRHCLACQQHRQLSQVATGEEKWCLLFDGVSCLKTKVDLRMALKVTFNVKSKVAIKHFPKKCIDEKEGESDTI